MFVIEVGRIIKEIVPVGGIGFQYRFNTAIGPADGLHTKWGRTAKKSKAIQHYTKDVLLIGIIVKANFQRLVVIAKIEIGA
jgi:hypothetical protein